MTRTDNTEPRHVEATPVLNLREAAEGWHIVNVSVGPNDDPILLLSETALVPGVPHFSQPRTSCRIIHFTSDGRRVIDLPEPEQHPNGRHVQPLGNQSWLVVDPRVEDRDTQNAHVYGDTGSLLRSFYAGDGIVHMLTTNSGHIWLGYIDEGVFNYDDELGPSGLVCLDDHGIPVFRFNDSIEQSAVITEPGTAHDMMIADCYALNVGSDEIVWASYYTEFPLARIKNGQIDRFHRNVPVHGSYAFATLGDTFLFAGMHDEPHVLYRFSLQDMAVQRFTPVDEAGIPVSVDARRVTGRGPRLYMNTDETLYVVDLGAL